MSEPARNLSEVEDLLARMPLRPPPATMDARVEVARLAAGLPECAAAPVRRWPQIMGGFAAGALAAAAAVVLWMSITPSPQTPDQPAAPAAPVALATVPAPAAPAPSRGIRRLTLDGTAARAASYDATGPVELRQNWSRTLDEGLVTPVGAEAPLRRLRLQRLERVLLEDPRDDTRFEMTVPHEDVILIAAPVD
jgi:hypothetical protein